MSTDMQDAKRLATEAVAHLGADSRGIALDLMAKILPVMVRMRRSEPVRERDKAAVRERVSTLRKRWEVDGEVIDQLIETATRLLDPQLTQLVADLTAGLPPTPAQPSPAQS